jgi:transcriptional regulator with XRE-family HTH domain
MPQSFGAAVRNARTGQSLTQTTLAAALGDNWSQSKVADLEGGKRPPSIRDLRDLHACLALSPEWMVRLVLNDL